eukprot:10919887-Alexandrium_andersonii.AAC.1
MPPRGEVPPQTLHVAVFAEGWSATEAGQHVPRAVFPPQFDARGLPVGGAKVRNTECLSPVAVSYTHLRAHETSAHL